MGFLLKKTLGELLMPLPVIFGLAVVGMLVVRRGRRPRVGRGLLAAAATLLWLTSCGPVSSPGLEWLERRHPAFPDDSVDVVVVLGSGHVADRTVPAPTRLSGQGLYRLTEGIRIAEAQPWARVILSGYGGNEAWSTAEAYHQAAVALGVAPERLTLEARPRDTAEEARLLAPLLRGRRFALVTSATHMPRAVSLFEAQGLDPLPAPTGHIVKGSGAWHPRLLLPRPEAMVHARVLWYEILGGMWVRLRGQT